MNGSAEAPLADWTPERKAMLAARTAKPSAIVLKENPHAALRLSADKNIGFVFMYVAGFPRPLIGFIAEGCFASWTHFEFGD
jgi:hypothetical protein